MSIVKRLLVSIVAMFTLVGIVGGSAQGATPVPTSESDTEAASTVTSDIDAERDQIVRDVTEAKSHLEVGESEVVHHTEGARLVLTQPSAGNYTLEAQTTDDGNGMAPMGICHSAAMTAVYTIGAAAFAGAAFLGGITVLGVAITAEAAGAMGIAMSAGAGVSGLVSLYIC